MKLTIVVILALFEVQLYYCKELCSVPCDEYETTKLLSKNQRVIHPDSFGMNLENIGIDNIRDRVTSDIESADKIGEITPLEGRKCGRIISKCVRDSDCCTGYCQSMMGRCLFNPFHHSYPTPKCLKMHNQCLYNYQCCSGVCDPVTGLCQHHLVTLHPPLDKTTKLSCSPVKGPCQVNAHCCSNNCDTKNGSCNDSKTKELDGKVIAYPELLNTANVPEPKQTFESIPEEDDITESEHIKTKEIKKESKLTRDGSLIVEHEEVYETSTSEKKNGEHLPSPFLSSAQNPHEKFSINKQWVLESPRRLGDEVEPLTSYQQQNVDGSSVQRRFETISAHNQGNIGGSVSSEKRLTESIPQKELLLIKRILENSSSNKLNDEFKPSSHSETNATSTKFLHPEQQKLGRVNPNTEIASATNDSTTASPEIVNTTPTNDSTTASPELVNTTPKSQENPQETATMKCSLNGQKCLHDDDCCSAICSHSSNSCTPSSSQSSSPESILQPSNKTCLEDMSTQ